MAIQGFGCASQLASTRFRGKHLGHKGFVRAELENSLRFHVYKYARKTTIVYNKHLVAAR
ncbi:MAG: hypothetical protein A2Z97_07615 [Bdellovibrionales bacterium GWB1_52_6]|nr:MAG: hypothetical protein A2Z97_07615 [Bdellovibrionales bacterium GWB1_52_6]